MPLQQKKHEVFYNTKTKVYRTGAMALRLEKHTLCAQRKEAPCMQEAPASLRECQFHKITVLCSCHPCIPCGASCMQGVLFALGTKRVFCCKDKCTIPYSILFY